MNKVERCSNNKIRHIIQFDLDMMYGKISFISCSYTMLAY